MVLESPYSSRWLAGKENQRCPLNLALELRRTVSFCHGERCGTLRILVALFPMAMAWNKSNFPLMHGWIKEVKHIYKGNYSEVKKSGILFVATWMENLVVNEATETQRQAPYVLAQI